MNTETRNATASRASNLAPHERHTDSDPAECRRRMRLENEWTHKAATRLGEAITGIGGILGRDVEMILQRRLEDLAEHQAEFVWWAEKLDAALTEEYQRDAFTFEARATVSQKLAELSEGHAVEMAREFERRRRRSGLKLPADLDMVVDEYLRADEDANDREPF